MHAREYERQASGIELTQVGREGGCAGRIVGRVEQDLAAICQPAQVEPPWPRGSGERRSDGIGRHRNLLRVQQLEYPDGDQRIANLMRPPQANRDIPIIARRRAKGDGVGQPSGDRDTVGRANQRSAAILGDACDRSECLRLELPDDHRDARLDDAGLFPCDLCERRPEVLLMIVRDRCDGRRHRLNHICRIEAAAEADLQYRRVDAGAAKELERDGGRHFEERRVRLQHAFSQQFFDRRLNVGDGGHHPVCRDRPAFNHESFSQIDEVRRRVARRSVTGGAQPGVDHRRDRALAVRAGNVNRSERPLGMPEAADDREHVLEAELDAELSEAEEVRKRVGHRDATRDAARHYCRGYQARPMRPPPTAPSPPRRLGQVRCASRP